MAGHAQLKFVMTECSKTQIRLTGLIFFFFSSVLLIILIGKRLTVVSLGIMKLPGVGKFTIVQKLGSLDIGHNIQMERLLS